MTDFESRLRAALSDGVSDAPDATGLAGAARTRARRRRRTTLAGAAAAVVLAAVAIPVGLSAFGGGDHPPTAVDPVPPTAGFRYETWRQATIQVPADWGEGSMNSWCAGDVAVPPYTVERPGSTYAIGCTPASSFGVSFQEAEQDGYTAPSPSTSSGDYPRGSWIGAQAVAGVLVTVVAPDQELAQQILDSMKVVGSVDPNGCAVVADTAADGSADGMSVCRYGVADHTLVQSEVLTEADTGAARAALAEAPETASSPPCPTSPTASAEPPAGADDQFVVLNDRGTSYRVWWSGDRCSEWGVFSGGVRRVLTADVLHWALSPGWSGMVPDGMPLPRHLRTR